MTVDIICDFNELMIAVKNAEDGDVLLVGDIDFRPTSPEVAYNYMCIEIDLFDCRLENNAAFYDGGAIYIEGTNGAAVNMINCEISKKSAATAYGGLYSFCSPFDDPTTGGYKLNILLCSFEDNRVDTVYEYLVEDRFAWFSHPGDIFTNRYITLTGCYIVDAIYESDSLSSVIADRYTDRLKSPHISSNYSESHRSMRTI